MLFQIEIFTFFSSFFYILYFSGDKFYAYYKEQSVKKQEKKQRQELRSKKRKEIESIKKSGDITIEQGFAKHYISPEESEQIREISKRAHINISRGYLESARSLIVEGLALKKQDKDLNLLLADVYEREKKYQNAMYIYQDLLEIFGEDEYILQRLGNIYALLEKNKKAFETYARAFKQNRTNLEILDIMAHLALELGDYKKSFKYASLYLKEKPRDAEKLGIKGYCLEKQGKINEAVKIYRKVLDLQPYNTEIQDRVIKLEK